MMNKKLALELYRKVYLIRACEERIRTEYASDAMKTPVHLHIGAEAIAAGVLTALPEARRIFGTYRNHGLYLGQTGDVQGFFAEMYGKVDGCAAGKAGSMHLTYPAKGLVLTSAVVATTIPVAVGAAFANVYEGKKEVVAVFFGDGAVEEGAFWESLNFACLKKLPIFFICEDNDLAIHTLASSRQGFRSIPEAVAGFDCHVVSADGYDPGVVCEVVESQFKKMENDLKPCFLHFKYFRYLQHVGVFEDFDANYRNKPDEKTMKSMDPLQNATKLVEKWGVSEDEILRLKSEIDQEIQQSVQFAQENGFPDEEVFKRGVYS